MKNKNFSSFDYDTAERERLEGIYSATFPDDNKKITGKDILNNSSERITITSIDYKKGVALGETSFGQTIIIDVKKEKKNMIKLGYPSIEINEGQVLDVVIQKDSSGSFNGSVSSGYEKALKRELHRSIKNEDCAFKIRVKNVCNGGFMVDLSGIECFLPGSLAAANRIMNFADYVGKELNVMIEIYDQKRDIFVVSFKKYLRKIIDKEVQNISFSTKYQGTVTGLSNSGVFVEWDEIYTGIIPIDDSNKDSLEKYQSGDTIEFYVVDIKNPQRINLSVSEPNQKMKVIQELKDTSFEVLGENTNLKIYKGEVTKIKTFGIFVKMQNGLNGLIEKEKLVSSIKEYEVGQSVDFSILSVDSSSLKIQLIEK
ncbi:MAG: 30S ribosomal protein S1 [Spirochaetia bacterium]|nr:30S ribosomal protein S1 [Spirochaetia bacterium]